MRGDQVYSGLLVRIVQLFPLPDNYGSDARRARELGSVCRIHGRVHDTDEKLWWLQRTDGRMTVCDVAEFEVVRAVSEATLETLSKLRDPFKAFPPPPGPRRVGLYRSQRDAYEDGWRDALGVISKFAREMEWKIDDWGACNWETIYSAQAATSRPPRSAGQSPPPPPPPPPPAPPPDREYVRGKP